MEKWLYEQLGLTPAMQIRVLATVIALFVVFLIRFIALKIAVRTMVDTTRKYEWRKNTLYVAAAISVLIIGRLWWTGFQSLITFLGLVSAGLAIALKDSIANMAGWLFIISRRPFHIGDRIQIGELIGDIIDIRMFEFSVMEVGNWVYSDQSTGRIVHVPNGKIFTEHQANYTQAFPYIWNEVAVTVTFESNWEEAKKVLNEIAQQRCDPETEKMMERQIREAQKRFLIMYSTLTPIVYTSVVENGIRFVIRYLCHSRQRRTTEQQIWEAVLRAFQKRQDIHFAYPTTRFFDRGRENENKPGPEPAGFKAVPPPEIHLKPNHAASPEEEG